MPIRLFRLLVELHEGKELNKLFDYTPIKFLRSIKYPSAPQALLARLYGDVGDVVSVSVLRNKETIHRTSQQLFPARELLIQDAFVSNSKELN
jgi:hypothetical protein